MRKNKDNLVVKEDAAAHAYKFVKMVLIMCHDVQCASIPVI